jgi:hypothetical protein
MKDAARLAVVVVVLGFSFSQNVAALRPSERQVPAATSHPTFSGTWTPSDPARSDKFFSVGVNRIPGRGRLTIEQRADRLMVTITLPDDILDSILPFYSRFYPTVFYRLSDVPGREGGAGAGGPPPLSRPTWFGERLVIPDPWPGSVHPTTETYSLDGNRLKLETHIAVSATRANDLAEWFNKVG